MRLRKIDFKQLSTSIGAVVAFLSFFVTLFKGVYQERPLTLSCIVLLVFMLMLGLALENMKKQTRSRIINTILNQKFPITALAQYAVYVSHDIRNSKIVLSSEMATVYLFTNNDNLSSLMSLVQYDILGNVKNKYMSESKITATYSKEPSEAFNSLSIDIIDNLTDKRIPPIHHNEHKYKGANNQRLYDICFDAPLGRHNPCFNCSVKISDNKPMPLGNKMVYFFDPTNFASKVKRLKIRFITDSKEIHENYDISFYKLNKTNLDAKSLSSLRTQIGHGVKHIKNTYMAEIDFIQSGLESKIHNNYLYIMVISRKNEE